MPNLGASQYLLTVVLANSLKAPLSLPNQPSMFSTIKALLSAWEKMCVTLVELFFGNKDKFHSEGKLEELYSHDSRGALLMSR